MRANSNQVVNVFPILNGVFGFPDNWFEEYVPRLIHPAYLLMALLLIVSIGIMVLKRFEDNNLEKKLWNLPAIITILALWPFIILGLKDLVDTFNTFLIRDVFRIPWEGFGFPSFDSLGGIFGWTAKAIASLLPTLSYWIIYAFYMVFFFFYAALGPFVLAKGILYDEIDAFLELVKEITIIFLWQTTLAILVAFILPEIVSGKPYSSVLDIKANVFFLSIVLSVMILFVPTITRKFGNHLGSSFFPYFIRAGAMMLGIGAIGKGLVAAKVPIDINKWEGRSHKLFTALEFRKRRRHQLDLIDLEDENKKLEGVVEEYHHKEKEKEYSSFDYESQPVDSDRDEDSPPDLVRLSKRAKRELKKNKIVYRSKDETDKK